MKVTVPNPSVHVWFIVGARFKTNAFSLSLSHRYWHNLGFMDCSSYVTSDKKTIPFCNIIYSVTHETQSSPRINNNIILFFLFWSRVSDGHRNEFRRTECVLWKQCICVQLAAYIEIRPQYDRLVHYVLGWRHCGGVLVIIGCRPMVCGGRVSRELQRNRAKTLTITNA